MRCSDGLSGPGVNRKLAPPSNEGLGGRFIPPSSSEHVCSSFMKERQYMRNYMKNNTSIFTHTKIPKRLDTEYIFFVLVYLKEEEKIMLDIISS